MSPNCYWIRCFNCCDNNALCGQKRKPHLYCGCRERRKRLRQTASACETAGIDNDKQTLMETDSAADVLQFDFDSATKTEKWEVDSPTTPFTHYLDNVLQPGADFIVQATVLPNALRCVSL